MALQCGIVGLPNVGKSTLFNCLSNAKAQSANFPFCTIEPNVGVITVPDKRLEVLEQLVHPERVVPTNVEIVDIFTLSIFGTEIDNALAVICNASEGLEHQVEFSDVCEIMLAAVGTGD